MTALGTTDTEGGWRENKASGGVLMHVPSGEIVVEGLCMPHSPRWHDNRLWMLESGKGALGYVDLERGVFEEVTRLPGFTRGLSFVGPFAFVGLSQVRENVFDGIPLRAEGVERSCGVWAVDLRTGATAAFLRFEGIVQELFEVLPLPGVRYPEIVEPGAELLESAFVLSDEAMADVVSPKGINLTAALSTLEYRFVTLRGRRMPLDPNKLTRKTGEALERRPGARARAATTRQVTPEHLLAALVGQPESVVLPVLERIGVSSKTLRDRVDDALVRRPQGLRRDRPAGAALARRLPGARGGRRRALRPWATTTSPPSTCSWR